MKKSNTPYEKILGQEKIIENLTQVVEKKQVSHSYIFSGPEDSQKREVAQGLAKALFSKGHESSQEALYKRIEEDNHPDLIDIVPQGATIRINQIRQLRQDISIKPLEADYKIYIINQADTMRPPAQNALLKTLEEPPEYGIIILLTNNISALLPTIVSRSQQLKFQKPDSKTNQLLQNDDTLQERRELLESILRIIKGDTILAFQKAQWFKDNKEHMDHWLDFLIQWFRDIALYKELGHNPWIEHKEYEDYLENFAKHLSTDQIHVIIEEINTSKNNMKYNVNLQLNIETMLLKMQED